jgi:hypothetical protein
MLVNLCPKRIILENLNGGYVENTGINREKKRNEMRSEENLNNGLTELYGKYLAFADQMAVDHSALEIAAVMMAQAMSIYKTTLAEEEFNNVIDVMSMSRDSVKTFNRANLQ